MLNQWPEPPTGYQYITFDHPCDLFYAPIRPTYMYYDCITNEWVSCKKWYDEDNDMTHIDHPGPYIVTEPLSYYILTVNYKIPACIPVELVETQMLYVRNTLYDINIHVFPMCTQCCWISLSVWLVDALHSLCRSITKNTITKSYTCPYCGQHNTQTYTVKYEDAAFQ